MKISIVTVCWNSEKYISDAIESVLSQNYDDVEYIIIDGGSTDKTIEIVKKYKKLSKIDFKWISERDSGIYDAMNKGLKMAKGDVVGILNSDDFYTDENVLSEVMQAFKSLKNIECVYADLYYVDEINTDKIVRRWITGQQKSFSKGWHPAHPVLFVKNEVYKKFGYFDTQLKIAADFEIMLRFLEKHKIKALYLKMFLLKMRMGGESNKSLKNIKKGKQEIISAFKNNNIYFPAHYMYIRWIKKIFQYIQ
ncbi:family 2 glycosyl transferase [Chryseobacterium sp. Leaf180]|uniref:glycosyltransferase family 2 protein n=1 Tax=Chryseobacterium sp. Leaf180 TaxID=1736289 RepID=UPI0006F98E70|nr:glycosyltransferase family 2 protein [Chryseobacterium sp. Leaf180]KQR93535.1 family 2 glycosyl transferase [Chryseobacterium sp. Leaf180]